MKALIVVHNIDVSDEETENSELTTVGTYEVHKDKICITYQESEVTGFDKSETEIIYNKNDELVSVIRRGEALTNMVLQQGKMNFAYYETPMGILEFNNIGLKIDSTLTETGGTLFLRYQIAVNGNVVGTHEITFDIKEVENSDENE